MGCGLGSNSSEHGNKPLGSMKCSEFLDQLALLHGISYLQLQIKNS